jgi:hypothetical protein
MALDDDKSGWCKYYHEHLRWDKWSYLKCNKCIDACAAAKKE